MGLQDDFFDLDHHLKGWQRTKMRRIWRSFCEAEKDANDASEAVNFVNTLRVIIGDKKPLCFTRNKRK